MPHAATDQFWQYAKEAILSAGDAKTEEDKQDLPDLTRTWTQAALENRASATSLHLIYIAENHADAARTKAHALQIIDTRLTKAF